jgi:hypothetical protein
VRTKVKTQDNSIKTIEKIMIRNDVKNSRFYKTQTLEKQGIIF